MDIISYKDYLRKVKLLPEDEVRKIKETEGNNDREYLMMVQEILVDMDERTEED